MKKLALNPYLHLTILTLVILAVFSRTLGTYFLADDFGEVAYVSRIAGGDLGMLWANFSGNYMQIPSMSVWRPCLLLTVLIDYLVWGANPLGFYTSNLFYYTGTCLSIYIFIRQLTSDWCSTRSSLAAFFAALIFALNPLHCESVTWVVGRVDVTCAFFYMICLNLFIVSIKPLAKHRRLATILSVVAFWLAMWCKEMAIGAPALAVAIALFWGQPALNFKKSFIVSAPLLISTVIYFVLRFLALGTLTGGYTQGIGDAQAAGALTHWLDIDTTRRLFFPLVYSIYGSNHCFFTALALIYGLLGVLFTLRLVSLSLPLRWVLFLPLWLATALAPIYKLWGLGYELEGARFVFFTTMPLAVFFPIFLLAPHSSAAASKSDTERMWRRAFAALSLFGLGSQAIFYGKLTSNLNLEWVHAGKEVREFAEKSRAIASAAAPEDNIVILGIPKRHGGAHMVLNGTTFKMLLQPPFNKQNLPDKFLTFDPIIFGNSSYINAARLRDSLALPRSRIIMWDSEKRDFVHLALAPGKKPLPQIFLPDSTPPLFLHTLGHALIEDMQSKPVVSHITAGDGIYFTGFNFSPLDADFMEVTVTPVEAASDRALTLTCSWSGSTDNIDQKNKEKNEGSSASDQDAADCSVSRTFMPTKNGPQKVLLRLSQNYKWFGQETVKALFLQLPTKTKIMVQAVRLLKSDQICPTISLEGAGAEPINATGVYPTKPHGSSVKVRLPGALQKGQVVVEISKPNAFFENFSDSDQKQTVLTTLKKDAIPSGQSLLDFALPPLPPGVNYEIRARVLDQAGLNLGEASDPIVIRVN